MDGQLNGDLSGFRLVTVCGSGGSKHDAMRDSQDILEPKFAQRGIEVCPLDLGRWDIAIVPKLVSEVRRLQPDGILMQYPTGAFGHRLGPVMLTLVQHKAPTMVMLHEFSAAHPIRKLAVGGLLLRVDRIGLTAERERKELVGRYPWLSKRTRMVPIGSNIPECDWSPTQPPKVVHFGQFRPNKGIEQFLACVPRIRAAVPQAQFEMIGATVPQLRDYKAGLQRDADAQGVIIRSDLEIDEVASALAEATVALLPFPGGTSMRRGSMLAAAACGMPIVAIVGEDTPAELLNYIEPAETEAELVGLTTRYLTDERARAAAHQRSVQLRRAVSWDATVDSYCSVFRELARLAGR